MSEETARLIQTITSVGSMLATAVGLLFIYIQIRDAAKTARGQNTMGFLVGDQFRSLRAAERAAAEGVYDPSDNSQLDEETVRLIMNDHQLRDAVRAKLNLYEAVCSGINHKALDEELYQDFSSRSVRISYWKYIRYIDASRDEGGNTDLYLELQNIARKWDKHPRVSHRFFDEKGNVIRDRPYADLAVRDELSRN